MELLKKAADMYEDNKAAEREAAKKRKAAEREALKARIIKHVNSEQEAERIANILIERRKKSIEEENWKSIPPGVGNRHPSTPKSQIQYDGDAFDRNSDNNE